jgi:hypothetical protein
MIRFPFFERLVVLKCGSRGKVQVRPGGSIGVGAIDIHRIPLES